MVIKYNSSRKPYISDRVSAYFGKLMALLVSIICFSIIGFYFFKWFLLYAVLPCDTDRVIKIC